MITRETKFRLAFSLLLLALLALVAKNAFGQPPVESSLGTFPLPEIVGMSGAKSVSIDINPKVAITNPYKTTTFRVRIRIEPDKANTRFEYTATCGAEIKRSVRDVDAITFTWFEELVVIENCLFEVRVLRNDGKQPLSDSFEVHSQ